MAQQLASSPGSEQRASLYLAELMRHYRADNRAHHAMFDQLLSHLKTRFGDSVLSDAVEKHLDARRFEALQALVLRNCVNFSLWYHLMSKATLCGTSEIVGYLLTNAAFVATYRGAIVPPSWAINVGTCDSVEAPSAAVGDEQP